MINPCIPKTLTVLARRYYVSVCADVFRLLVLNAYPRSCASCIGIYDCWDDGQEQVFQFSNAYYRAFSAYQDAVSFYFANRDPACPADPNAQPASSSCYCCGAPRVNPAAMYRLVRSHTAYFSRQCDSGGGGFGLQQECLRHSVNPQIRICPFSYLTCLFSFWAGAGSQITSLLLCTALLSWMRCVAGSIQTCLQDRPLQALACGQPNKCTVNAYSQPETRHGLIRAVLQCMLKGQPGRGWRWCCH